MMYKLVEAVKELVREELARASEQHGPDFHSLHEAYAVLLEEIEETKQEIGNLNFDAQHMWSAVRHDNHVMFKTVADAALAHAINAASEAIQVAAVAHKTLNTVDRYEKEMQQK